LCNETVWRAPKFQPTHPHGVRPKPREFVVRLLQVSTHAPARGATFAAMQMLKSLDKFQPTHPHGVRRNMDIQLTDMIIVSTHAPARGATIMMALTAQMWHCFNPRTRTGCDRRSPE